MTRLDYYWLSDKAWWHWSGGIRVLNDDAPEEAKKSYERYLEQLKAAQKRGAL